jgi:succinate dehydrogenase / fumarate reductase, flavoprotein subunit
MQGLADGYFIIPYTLGNYLASNQLDRIETTHSAFEEAETTAREKLNKLLSIQGEKTVSDFHRQLGKLLWDYVGMARNRQGLEWVIAEISRLGREYWQNVKIPGRQDTLNKNLEFAGRVADFLELGELMARDALAREESCGAHFREEYQTPEGEAQRDDTNFVHVAAWEYTGEEQKPLLHREQLEFTSVELTQRSYK